MDEQPTNTPKKVFDVMRPGTATPSPNSRPLIGNQDVQSDPMVKEVAEPSPVEPVPEPASLVLEAEKTTPSDAIPAAISTDIPSPQSAAQAQPEADAHADVRPPSNEDTPTSLPAANLPPADVVNQVVVAHHKTSNRSSRLILIVILVLLVAAIALDLLLDSGIIKSNAIPHSHLFGN